MDDNGLDRVMEERLRAMEAAIRGEVVHTSAVSRIWATLAAAAVIAGLILTAGRYLQQLDQALDALPAVQKQNRDMERRIDRLEQYHLQGSWYPLPGDKARAEAKDVEVAHGY